MQHIHGPKPHTRSLVGLGFMHQLVRLSNKTSVSECLIDSAAYIEFKDPLSNEAFETQTFLATYSHYHLLSNIRYLSTYLGG